MNLYQIMLAEVDRKSLFNVPFFVMDINNQETKGITSSEIVVELDLIKCKVKCWTVWVTD